MQLLAKAANGSDNDKATAKIELTTNVVNSAQKGDWDAVADYATAAFTAHLITQDELVTEIATSFVDSLDKPEGKTCCQGGGQGTVGGINFSKLHQHTQERGRDFAIFAAKEELLRLAKQGNEQVRTLFP
jgi:hypothetical protein